MEIISAAQAKYMRNVLIRLWRCSYSMKTMKQRIYFLIKDN